MKLSVHEWYRVDNEPVVGYISMHDCICSQLFMILLIGCGYVNVVMI